jgi:hypothetical protein
LVDAYGGRTDADGESGADGGARARGGRERAVLGRGARDRLLGRGQCFGELLFGGGEGVGELRESA